MTNVDEILNYKRKEEEDYYGILGCDETSTVSRGRLGAAHTHGPFSRWSRSPPSIKCGPCSTIPTRTRAIRRLSRSSSF